MRTNKTTSMNVHRLLFSIGIFALLVTQLLAQETEQGQRIDFAKDIQPILRASCYSCHGSDAQEGGLRLDNRARAFVGGDNGKAIVSGDITKGLLLTLIKGTDEDLGRMPPEGEGTPLTEQQITLIQNWIAQGAEWPDSADIAIHSDHWSFQPLVRPELPMVEQQDWIKSPIDKFVLARLEQDGIAPSSRATRSTLIRRVYLDLLGLLPSAAEVEQFLNDQRTDAYQQMVNRALESPHYGERWGRHWLDLARYADSDGYEKDRARPHAWRYRDWVIHSLNADMPFDQFTIAQIAGDMLPEASVSQRVASGFHRNTLHNTEGGTDQEEDRVKKTVDRTNTFGTIWLGLTVGCAQCHSHKYDPISHREYYQLYSFFNSMNEQDVAAPTIAEANKFTKQQQQYAAEHEQFVAARTKYESEQLPNALAKWLEVDANLVYQWKTLTASAITGRHKATFKTLEDGSILVEGENVRSDIYTITGTADSLSGIRLEVIPDDRLPKKGPGRAENGNFVLTNVQLLARQAGSEAEFAPLKINRALADFSQSNWEVAKAINENAEDGWAVSPEIGKPHVAVFQLENLATFEGGIEFKVVLDQKYETGSTHNLGRFRISHASFDGVLGLDGTPAEVLDAIAAETRNAQQEKVLLDYYKQLDDPYKQLVQAEEEHEAKAPKQSDTKAQSVVELGEARQAHIHLRGNFLTKGEMVETKGLDVLPTVAAGGEKLNRLDLAHWTVSDENPLTARVTVNRVWQRYFGRGIVETSDDFGLQGSEPTHPGLLDWLAVEFREQKWSLKHLHRTILNSAVYQQVSAHRTDLEETDPDNELLARQYRSRVEAEIIRDLALDASGLIVETVGGPSVRPPQPAEYSSLTYANSARWQTSEGDNRYRRGMYTFFQRTSPYPMLMTFDAPDSNVCIARRSRSNTPLQALTIWNDVVFTECAQNLGRRVVREVASSGKLAEDVRKRVYHTFLTCLSRRPTRTEMAVVTEFYRRQFDALSRDEAAAKEVLGDSPMPESANLAETASWVAVARVLLNTDEFITKE